MLKLPMIAFAKPPLELGGFVGKENIEKFNPAMPLMIMVSKIYPKKNKPIIIANVISEMKTLLKI